MSNVIRPRSWQSSPPASTRAPRPVPPSDAELIEAVATGDARLAGSIHDRLIGVVDQSLYRVLGSRHEDHDDLVQICFEQIIRTLADRSFAGHCSLSTWAARISTYVALNALRSRCRERKVIARGESDVIDRTLESGERTVARAELGQVRAVLTAMNPEKAEVLLLHDVHGHSLSEIATLLGITVAAAQSRLVRSRAEFQTRFAKKRRRDRP